MTQPTTRRTQLLVRAERLVNGDRNRDYGPPSEDFARTAAMWTAYLGHPVQPYEVGICLALVKFSRAHESPGKADHYADAAGYIACAYDCSPANLEPKENP